MCAQACATPDASTTHGVVEEIASKWVPSAPGVRYHLQWNWGSAVPTEEGWRVTNDLGYLVEVTEGYMVTDSVQLAPCTDEDPEGVFALLKNTVVGEARAGHAGTGDPSAWLVGIAESLKNPKSVSLDPIVVSAGFYCRAHYLVARAGPKTMNLPDHMVLVGKSLYIAGNVTSEHHPSEPFSISSSLPAGQLMTWADSSNLIDLSQGGVDVIITRDLGRLFHGIDFNTMNAEAMEKTLLLGLTSRGQVHIQ